MRPSAATATGNNGLVDGCDLRLETPLARLVPERGEVRLEHHLGHNLVLSRLNAVISGEIVAEVSDSGLNSVSL